MDVRISKMRVFLLHLFDFSCLRVRVSVFLHFRRCSQIFVDFRIRQNPWVSIDWNPSGETRLESRNEIISDLSLAMFLAHFIVFSIFL